MTHSRALFIALLVAVSLRFSGGFVAFKSSPTHTQTLARRRSCTTATPTIHAPGAGCAPRQQSNAVVSSSGGVVLSLLPSTSGHRHLYSCLQATIADGEEGTLKSTEAAQPDAAGADATATDPGADTNTIATGTGAEGEGGAGTGVDLAKGISFEAPKPRGGMIEEEEESKKFRVILYTVLSLVPFLLLLPFLGGNELVPLDPGQM